MAMEREEPCSAPDTFGLPEFFVTDIMTEIDGTNVRMFCGVRRGGQVHWLYTAVMPAETLLRGSRQCTKAAQEATNLLQIGNWRRAH